MTVQRTGRDFVLQLSEAPPENSSRDVPFRSGMRVNGTGTLVVLRAHLDRIVVLHFTMADAIMQRARSPRALVSQA